MKVKIDKNSMLYWYPKIKGLNIPQPMTIIIKVNPKIAYGVLDGVAFYPEMDKFIEAIRLLGLPIFIRTDHMSGKHDWKSNCFLDTDDKAELQRRIYGLIDSTLGCDVIGKDVNAFCFREYIPMDSKYTAFWGDMPVNPERRYFVENGKVLCHHPYWIKESIVNPSVKNWEKLSNEMNKETSYEIDLLTAYAMMVSVEFEGFWSVDFCKAKDGRWILIDMAIGEHSWHPEDCPNNRTEKIDLLQQFAKKKRVAV